MDNKELIQGIKIFGHARTFRKNKDFIYRYGLKNEIIRIDISFGNLYWSVPADLLSLEEYEKVCVRISYCDPIDDKMYGSMPVNLRKDFKFIDQKWEMYDTLDIADQGFGVLVSLDTMCEMIRYCYRLESMKAFW